MLELIRDSNYKLLDFHQFFLYMEEIPRKKISLIYTTEEYDWMEHIFRVNDEFIRFYLTKDKEKELIQVFRYKEEDNPYEQTEFIRYTNNLKDENNNEYNIKIKHASHLDGSEYSKLIVSEYIYIDNQYIKSFKKQKKIKLEDLNSILVPGMNLFDLPFQHEEEIIDFKSKYESYDKERKLVIGYDE